MFLKQWPAEDHGEISAKIIQVPKPRLKLVLVRFDQELAR
jgi:hypothetical protein